MTERWQRALFTPLTLLAWLVLIAAVVWVLSHVGHTVLLVALATVIAFAVTPAVGLLSRWLPRIFALAVTYLLVFAVLVAVVGVVAYAVAGQLGGLVQALPQYAEDAKQVQPAALRLLGPLGVTPDQLNTVSSGVVARLQEFGGRAASDAFGFARAFLTAVVDAVLVVMLSIYLAANGPRIRAWLETEAPPAQRRRARMLGQIVNRVVGGYVRGTLTLAALVGALVGVSMGVLGVRYAALLGVVAFFMEFVPVLGVFVSGALCVLVALFQGWILALIVLAVFVVVHVIEGDVVGPRIMGAALGIHPAVSLVALLAGTELFGLWGALFGAPVAGLLQAVAVVAWQEVKAGGARAPGPASRR